MTDKPHVTLRQAQGGASVTPATCLHCYIMDEAERRVREGEGTAVQMLNETLGALADMISSNPHRHERRRMMREAVAALPDNVAFYVEKRLARTPTAGSG